MRVQLTLGLTVVLITVLIRTSRHGIPAIYGTRQYSEAGGLMNEKLRQLRQQLSETSDELQRKELLSQIREIEEEIEGNPPKI
ncbi:MAG: hypothetical protein WCC81_19070 [Pseudolabrys sp.]